MYLKVNGLVLREVPYKEYDKMLTVLTGEEGKLTVNAKGARRRTSKLAGTTQLMTYSNMTLFRHKDRLSLNEAELIESFIGLRDRLEAMALGAYICELSEALAPEGVESHELLAVALNTLYALSRFYEKPFALIKAACELRLMSISGYQPMADFCPECGKTDICRPVLNIYLGEVYCKDCWEYGKSIPVALTDGALFAIRYVIHGSAKKLFSFSLDDESLSCFEQAMEGYVYAQLERGFSALDFYKNLEL